MIAVNKLLNEIRNGDLNRAYNECALYGDILADGKWSYDNKEYRETSFKYRGREFTFIKINGEVIEANY